MHLVSRTCSRPNSNIIRFIYAPSAIIYALQILHTDTNIHIGPTSPVPLCIIITTNNSPHITIDWSLASTTIVQPNKTHAPLRSCSAFYTIKPTNLASNYLFSQLLTCPTTNPLSFMSLVHPSYSGNNHKRTQHHVSLAEAEDCCMVVSLTF